MNKKNNNKGFTLIELIIVVAILAIFMVAATTLIVNTTTTYRVSNKVIQLQNDAANTLNNLEDSTMQATYVQIEDKNNNYYEGEGTVTNPKQFMVIDTDYYMYGVDSLSSYSLTGSSKLSNLKSIRALDGKQTNITNYIVMYAVPNDSADPGDPATIQMFAWYKYNPTSKCLYVRKGPAGTGAVAPAETDDYILTRNLESLKVSSDTDNNSIEFFLDYKNNSVTYSTSETIMIRNSNVLHIQHDYNCKVLQ